MEDVIAIKIVSDKDNYYVLTWGRVFDRIKEDSVLEIIKKKAPAFGIKDIQKISICESLQSASKEKYFYEALFQLGQTKIQYGKQYGQWKKAMAKQMLNGKQIYLVTA